MNIILVVIAKVKFSNGIVIESLGIVDINTLVRLVIFYIMET